MTKKPGRTNLRGADVEVLQILALQSRDPSRVRRVLDPRNPISASILPHVIPLLGDRGLGGDAMQAVQRVADRHPGALIDVLLNPATDATIRRRLARALSGCRSQTVVDGLLMTSDDELLDLRVQSARSLLRIHRRWPDTRIDRERVMDLIRAELARGAPDLGHLFTLLAFIVSIGPLRAAYRGLRSRDVHAKGTALEYLHGILPKDIRSAVLMKLE